MTVEQRVNSTAQAVVAAAKSLAKAESRTHRADIELQVELRRRHTGAIPAGNLHGIGTDLNYFPSGLLTCPVDGSTYTIDATGRVTGHNH